MGLKIRGFFCWEVSWMNMEYMDVRHFYGEFHGCCEGESIRYTLGFIKSDLEVPWGIFEKV